VSSVVIDDQWGTVTVGAGSANTIKEDGGANLVTPTLTSTVKDGVWTITVSCLGAPPRSAGVSVDGVVDLVNNCGDDITVTMPSTATLNVKSELGDITTSGINANQTLASQQGDVNVSNAVANAVKATTNEGNITLKNVTGDTATAETDSQYGYVTIDGCTIDTINASTNEGGVSISSCATKSVVALANRGGVDVQDTIVPDSVQAKSGNGAVNVVVPRGAYALVTKATESVLVSEIQNDPSSANKINAESDNGDVTVIGRQPSY
jgi:DUF4097 and DUF4098 domain-containing protein YvlB